MSCEERMAVRAAGRRVVRDAERIAANDVEDRARIEAARPYDEDAVEAEVAKWTPETVAEYKARYDEVGCACIGPTPPRSLCPCRIRWAAFDRVVSDGA